MITKVSTKEMPRDVWLERRTHSLGGSDAGTVLGLNPYSSPYALWAEKTGQITPEDISDKEAVRLGNDLEQYVADRWCEATGKKVRRENNMIYNDEYPFAHADIDRAVVGEHAGLECKTTSSWEILQRCRDGEFPEAWYCQMMHYLMVTGFERYYLGVLCFGKGFFEFTIERNEAEIEALANAEREFWHYVETKTPPPLDGTEATGEALTTILGDSSPGTSVDLTAVGLQLTAYCSIKEQIKRLENELADAQANIELFMGQAERGEYNGIKVSFKTQERKTFDRKAYEAERGEIPQKYFKVSTSRPFKVTEKKG